MIKKFFNFLKKNGLKKTLLICYEEWIDRIFIIIIRFLTSKLKLRNIIVIESHNDFDTNGGAFYDFLIHEKYNEKYLIIWLLKNKKPKILPYNVKGYMINRPSIYKDYYFCRAKFLLFDENMQDKVRPDQISVYCTHGGMTLKNVKGLLKIRESIDYMLSGSRNYDKLLYRNHLAYNQHTKTIHLGYPVCDVVLHAGKNEIKKITNVKYEKVFLWMPTFRQSDLRSDSDIDFPFGVPLIFTNDQLIMVNNELKKINSLMIIKIHPKQLLNNISETNQSNIIFLDKDSTKKKGIDNYRLMACADALLTDYSSVTYTYLLLNRPMGFVLSDIGNYMPGFVVDNPKDFLPGAFIYDMRQLIEFLENVVLEQDSYTDQREQLLQYLYGPSVDGNSCQRLAEFLKL